MELTGSKTEKNLQEAFAGESQARNKYTYFASKARKDGYVQIANIFEETAGNEKEHAKIWFKYLQGGDIKSTAENLKAAADVADMFFNIPDGFTAAATTAKQREIVAIALRMVAGDEAQQRGFSRAIRADNLPVLARIHRPAKMVKDRAVVIRDDTITQHDAWLVRIERVAG